MNLLSLDDDEWRQLVIGGSGSHDSSIDDLLIGDPVVAEWERQLDLEMQED